jgi:NifU-like protein involved in Fe-S cluster formation
VDEAIIKYYRKLLTTRFGYAGSLESPSIFLDNTVGDKVVVCGKNVDFLHLYINVVNNKIDDIKYKCTCDPTANVAIETLCCLVKGKTLDEAANVPESAFYQFLGTEGEILQKVVKGLKDLLNIGISRYKDRTGK